MASLVSECRLSGRHELSLQGDQVEEILRDEGIADGELFSIASLKVVSLTSCQSLHGLSAALANLKGLLTLTVSHCSLKVLPDEVGQLEELKFLDLSFNVLDSLPAALGHCKNLQTMNLSHNSLQDLPSFGNGIESLRRLDLSHNRFEALPLTQLQPVGLQELIACDNQLKSLSEHIGNLTLLKDLDVSDNKLEILSVELTSCSKLKSLNVEGNPIKDRRLAKLLASHGSRKPKAIFDYLSTSAVAVGSAGAKPGKGKKKGKATKLKSEEVPAEKPPRFVINVLQSDTSHAVTFVESVLPVRPYIACTIVKGLDLSTQEVMREFISLQTKLHDSVCEKRRVATVATHDLALLRFPLTYEARCPADINIRPLGQSSDITAAQLVQDMSTAKKGNDYPTLGLRRFLGLIADPDLYPCLMDEDGTTVSLPPLTNCDQTKVSAETRDVFVEVTSRKSVATCRMVLDLLVGKLCEGGFGLSGNDGVQELEEWLTDEKPPELVVQQVRINTMNEKLRVVYPSREDLVIDSVKVERSFHQK